MKTLTFIGLTVNNLPRLYFALENCITPENMYDLTPELLKEL